MAREERFTETGEAQSVVDSDPEYARGFLAGVTGKKPDQAGNAMYRIGHEAGKRLRDLRRRSRRGRR